LHINELLGGEYLSVLFLIGAIYVSTIAGSFYIGKLKKRIVKYKSSFNRLHEGAQDVIDTTSSFSNETLMSQYIAHVQKVDKDIEAILGTAELSLTAESVNMFLHEGGELNFKLASSKVEVTTTGDGLIYSVFQEKTPVLYNLESTRGRVKSGYVSPSRSASFVAVPVMDLSTPLGVLSAESSRYRAFDQQDVDLLARFATLIAKVLKRQRIYSQLDLEHKALQILHAESAHLGELLNIADISGRVVDSAEKIANARAIMFLKEGNAFRIVAKDDLNLKGRQVSSLKGTILQLVNDNREIHYRSDTTQDKVKVLPVELKGMRSVLAIPLFSENTVNAFLVVFSERRDAFNPFLIELLKVLANQASLGLSNAFLHEEIRMMAFTDGLTGLYNHRHFQEKLRGEFKRAERYNEKITLILTDIDHFKKINDTYGHPAGDAVLKSFSETIKSTVREIDIPARYGGEEFAILVVRADKKEAKKIAERIRKNVMDHEFKADRQSLRVTVSLGIASYPSDASSKEELLEKADQALYGAKEGGRNRTVLYADIMDRERL
jgi:diguanylate cyclase (GGDEF)-like protein